jgi:RNA polymerase sigma-70 factor, ECF subfamily
VLAPSGPGEHGSAADENPVGQSAAVRAHGEPGDGTVLGTLRDDRDFIQNLCAEHADFLLIFVQRLTGGDRHWAEDVVQETLLRAWLHADQLRDGEQQRSLRPWLATVARRIVINDRRRRHGWPQQVDAEMPDTAAAHDEIERTTAHLAIVDALAKIRPLHREIIVELYLRGRTPGEVAVLLGIPLGTVKSRTYYAMRALRSLLRDSR